MAFNEKLAHLLEERRIATLTTYSPDGLPHVTAVWFLYEDDAILMATNTGAGKASNLRRDPRMAICIESREAGRESGMSACGHAELLVGQDAVEIAGRINAKYLTPEGLVHPIVGTAFKEMSNLVIRLRPERWISWDMSALGSELFGEEVDEAEIFRPVLL